MADTDESVVERFRPTSGRVTGSLALALAAGVVVIGLLDREHGFSAPVVAAAVVGGTLAWASMLRPALWATRDELVMRNMLETVHIPLAAIEELAVRQVVAVRAGGRRYVSPVVGKSWRTMVRPAKRGHATGDRPLTELAYPDFVEQRLDQLVDDARAAAGVRRFSDEQAVLAEGVRRRPAWLPIGLVAAGLVALVVTLLV